MSRPGNPNWGKPFGNSPAVATSFEEAARQLRLSKSEYASSAELREWARRHRNSKYVPLDLLQMWGLHVDEN